MRHIVCSFRMVCKLSDVGTVENFQPFPCGCSGGHSSRRSILIPQVDKRQFYYVWVLCWESKSFSRSTWHLCFCSVGQIMYKAEKARRNLYIRWLREKSTMKRNSLTARDVLHSNNPNPDSNQSDLCSYPVNFFFFFLSKDLSI